MGFNSTIVVMNDYLHEIAKDKDFGVNVSDAIMGLAVGRQQRLHGAVAIETHHADDVMIIAVGGNQGRVLGYGGRREVTDDVELLKELARKLGYDLRKRRT